MSKASSSCRMATGDYLSAIVLLCMSPGGAAMTTANEAVSAQAAKRA